RLVQSGAYREQCRLGAVLDSQLGEHGADVRLYRFLREPQRPGDLPVGPAPSQLDQDLPLPGGQLGTARPALLPGRAQGRAIGWWSTTGTLVIDRYRQRDARPAAGTGPHLQCPADGPGALTHRGQPQSPRGPGAVAGVEAPPVVDDLEAHRAVAPPQRHP